MHGVPFGSVLVLQMVLSQVATSQTSAEQGVLQAAQFCGSSTLHSPPQQTPLPLAVLQAELLSLLVVPHVPFALQTLSRHGLAGAGQSLASLHCTHCPVVGLQTGVFPVQDRQIAPEMPHRWFVGGVTQTPFAVQQPLEQVCALHAMHRP